MARQQKIYTLIDADQDYFANNVTGASWTISTNATPNGEAYKIAILNNSATDHSGKTATIVGLDADQKAQTEIISLPDGNGAVYSTKYYSYVTNVTPSATIGADTMDIGTSEYFCSSSFYLDTTKTTIVAFYLESGTINYSCEMTTSELNDSVKYWQKATNPGQDLYEKTLSNNGFFLSSPNAIRFITNSFSGTPEFIIDIINNFGRG